MGQYLAVGLVTEVLVFLPRGAEPPKVPMTEEALRQRVNKFLPALDIYEPSPSPDDEALYQLQLRPSVWQGGLLPLLADIYPHLDPGQRGAEEHAEVLELLRATEPSTWLDLARERDHRFLCFGADRPFPELDSDDAWPRRRVQIHFEIVRLFLEGKVLAEEYRKSFRFFQHCMQVTFARHELAKALVVYFSG